MTEVAKTNDNSDAEASRKTSERVPLKVKIAYGGIECSSTLTFSMFTIYFLIFLTDTAGISASTASAILAISVLWDAVTDPVMGIVSDRTRSRYGRRRPYLVGVAVPFCIIFWLVFTTPPLQGYRLVAYFTVMLLLLNTAWTVLDVPYTALAPEMTTDYDERTSLATFRMLLANIGGTIGAATPLLIVEMFADHKVGWSVTSAIFGFVCIFPILLTWRGTRDWERHATDTAPLNVREVMGAVLGNRTFRYVVGLYLFGITGVYATGTIAVYFLEYLMGFDGEQTSLFFLVYYIFSILWVPLVPFLSGRIGKRLSYMILLSIWGIAGGIGAMVVQPGQVWLILALGMVAALGANAVYQLCWAMIPDVVEVDEFKTGKRREGMYYGVAVFVMKVGSAFALFIVGQVLDRIGYVPNAQQTPETLMGIRIMFGPLLTGLLVIAVILAALMPMTRKRHKALLRAIKAKKAGEPWDEESIKELL
jgi:GPH family glycoside/pentoside/hexuronide:cation symporter